MDQGGKRLKIAGFAISLIALAGVVVWASQQERPSLPSGSSEWIALIGAVAAYAAATIARGERWWWLLRDSGVAASRADAYGLNAVGYMGNNVIPARGGDAIRVLLMTRRTSARARTVVGTLVTERLLDVAFLLVLFVLLGYGVLRSADKPATGVLVATLGAIAALLVIVLLIAHFQSDRPIVKRIRDWVEPILHPTARLRGKHAGLMAGQTTTIWVLEAVTYVAVASSVGVDLSIVEAGYIIAVSSIFLLIPSGPGYVGTLDAAILFGLHAVDVNGSDAVSYLLMARFVLLVPVTLAGLVVLLGRYGGGRAMRSQPAE